MTRYLFLVLLIVHTLALAQGPLDPDTEPVPAMKSLQEIWDRLAVQRTQIAGITDQAAPSVNLAWTSDRMTPAGLPVEGVSLAFGPDGQPAIALAYGFDDLYYLHFNGATWDVTVVDAVGNVGRFPSLAFGPDGYPAISYLDDTNDDLKFARYDGAQWNIEVVESAGSVGYNTSLAFGPDGQPAIAYSALPGQDLKFAQYDGAQWNIVVADSNGEDGYDSSLAFGPDGHPIISHVSVTGLNEYRLELARFNGTSWINTIIDTSNGISGDLRIGPDGQPAVAYVDHTNNVKAARYNGTSWTPSLVATALASQAVSLAFDTAGRPSVAYHTPGKLMFARWSGVTWQQDIADVGYPIIGVPVSLAYGPDGQPAMAYAGNTGLSFLRKASFITAP